MSRWYKRPAQPQQQWSQQSQQCPNDEERERLLIGAPSPSSYRATSPRKLSRLVFTSGIVAKTVAFGALIAASAFMWPGGVGSINLSVTRLRPVPPPKACLAARTRSGPVHPEYHQSVPGSLELFVENGVVCPNQAQDDLQNGKLTSVSPVIWERHRRDQGGWEGEGRGRGLIVFKRGGSGSTWFDTLMGKHPDFDFRHEAHHNLYSVQNSKEKATNTMRKFLEGGVECNSEGGYCGFSISPSKHAAGVDWSELIRDTGATLVVFVRTNVVKRILGLQKKQLIKKKPSRCRVGSSYKADMKNDSDCVLDKSVKLPTSKVLGIDEACFVQSWELLETALNSSAPFQILTYEGMQQNLTTSLLRLGAFSGWPLDSFDWSSHVTTAKVSSEDLQTSISNYAEVEGQLKGKPCFLNMLHSKAQQIFPLCYSPRNFTMQELAS